jgi:hypothetical protein
VESCVGHGKRDTVCLSLVQNTGKIGHLGTDEGVEEIRYTYIYCSVPLSVAVRCRFCIVAPQRFEQRSI